MTTNTDDQLTQRIYAAMQLPYLSERHDAIKALILEERNKSNTQDLTRTPGDDDWPEINNV